MGMDSWFTFSFHPLPYLVFVHVRPCGRVGASGLLLWRQDRGNSAIAGVQEKKKKKEKEEDAGLVFLLLA